MRARDVLLVCLALTTGASDATAFERLGSVFASVLTGNLVLLGVSAVRAEGSQALFAGCAIGGYALGVLVASPRREPSDAERDRVWPRETTAALALDFTLLAAFAAWWELAGTHPPHAVQRIQLAIVAAAMGTQSSAVRRLGSMSTTYLTSTTTGIVEALAVWRWSRADARSIGIIVAAVAGAALAIALVDRAHAWLPAAQLVPLGMVLALSPRLWGIEPPDAGRSP